jgi:hypothetical protein|tara:strand:+ start:1932 stop:2243 length:312 start_codon:yes stop_codon:yes gene_type:complete
MRRSQEIIITLSKYLPTDIIQYILSMERKILFERNIYQWIYFSQLFHTEKYKRLFHQDLKDIFLREIKDIQGSFVILKRNKEKLWSIKRENKIYSNYLRSVRY